MTLKIPISIYISGVVDVEVTETPDNGVMVKSSMPADALHHERVAWITEPAATKLGQARAAAIGASVIAAALKFMAEKARDEIPAERVENVETAPSGDKLN